MLEKNPHENDSNVAVDSGENINEIPGETNSKGNFFYFFIFISIFILLIRRKATEALYIE